MAKRVIHACKPMVKDGKVCGKCVGEPWCGVRARRRTE
jgi:hypothetical protein